MASNIELLLLLLYNCRRAHFAIWLWLWWWWLTTCSAFYAKTATMPLRMNNKLNGYVFTRIHQPLLYVPLLVCYPLYFTPLLSFSSSIQQWRLKTLAFSGKHLLRVKFLVIVETLGQTYCWMYFLSQNSDYVVRELAFVVLSWSWLRQEHESVLHMKTNKSPYTFN